MILICLTATALCAGPNAMGVGTDEEIIHGMAGQP